MSVDAAPFRFDPAGIRPVRLPPGQPPVLVVVVDAEEEFDWSRPLGRGQASIANIAAQPLAHREVFDPCGVRPIYVVDYPVAADPAAAAVLRRLQDAGRCEIGAHLHPWVTPPFEERLTPANSYAGNLPPGLEKAKLERLTAALVAAFGRRPLAYKAGRYGIGRHTGRILSELGYRIDLSALAGFSFGDDGGPDFTACPASPFRFGPEGGILALPLTGGYAGLLAAAGPRLFPLIERRLGRRLRLPGILARSRLLERGRLTPESLSLVELIRLTRALLRRGERVFSLAYHSPSLLPGCTPYVRHADDLRAFLDRLRGYLGFFRGRLGGEVLTPGELLSRLTAS